MGSTPKEKGFGSTRSQLRLGSTCQSMFDVQLDESPQSCTLHESTRSLYASMESGCFICSLYRTRVPFHEQTTSDAMHKHGEASLHRKERAAFADLY